MSAYKKNSNLKKFISTYLKTEQKNDNDLKFSILINQNLMNKINNIINLNKNIEI